MPSYVILLRGVMPTGKNKVLMAPLRESLAAAGLKNVQTYIQSGNVVAASSLSQKRVEGLVHDVIAERFAGDIAVLARSAGRFREVLARNPFPDAELSRLYFCILAETPETARVRDLTAQDHSPDHLRIIGDVAYLNYATRYSDSKLNNNFIERKLGVVATTRNYNTVARLVELSQAHSTTAPRTT